MKIPSTITQEHINRAIETISKSDIPERNESKVYSLMTEDGKAYPPKYVIEVAGGLAGEKLSTADYTSIEANAFLKKMGFSIVKQPDFELTITATAITSTDPSFDLGNLGEGDPYIPLEAHFIDQMGKVITRNRSKRERSISNQTLPKLAFQIYESQISSLSDNDKQSFPVCRYTPKQKMICGIFKSADDFKKYKNTLEFLTYVSDSGVTYVIYCWNIFSTLYFVQECLKRFGHDGERFVLKYRFKEEKGENTPKEQEGKDNTESTDSAQKETDIALNTILYGPPGTGKTYHTAIYAVAICDGMTEKEAKARDYKTEILPRYEELIAEKRIVFTTFHQSYGYEDFMEGIKPKATDGSVVYQIESGVFKRFCQDWLNDAWCCLVEDAKKNGNKVSVPWLNTADELCLEYKQTQDGEQAFYDSFNKDENSRYHNATKSKLCKWLDNVAKGLDENTSFPANRRPLNLCKAVYEKLKSEYSPEKLKERSLPPKVFIIDEINRGNISKIFGELITLIEDDKRGSACVTLPYSGESFTVPKNVYVLGTMNTADRSIALMDTALRRRFTFTEMMPVPSLLSDDADGVSVRKLLTAINDRIEYLYDREHTVGHAYFKEFIGGNGGIAALRKIFKDKLLPLLQEYFYDDYEKIALVLADGSADEGERFIKERKKAFEALGGGYGEEKKYDVNNDVWKLSDDAFKARLLKIYHDLPDEADA